MAFKLKPVYRYLLIGGFLLLAGAGITIWLILTDKFSDTKDRKPHFTVEAPAFINEFSTNLQAANAKYTEKIVVVNGTVSAVEPADTTMNIKMEDSTGAYAIFAFQEQYMEEARKIKEGDKVSIKGSCSGGAFSDILETTYITFKRCTIDNSKK